MSEMQQSPVMKLWHIEDGGQHWVAAVDAKRAVEVLAETTGYKTLQEYYESIGTSQVGVSEWKKYVAIDVQDELGHEVKRLGYPEGSRVKIVIRPEYFCLLEEGIVATSEV